MAQALWRSMRMAPNPDGVAGDGNGVSGDTGDGGDGSNGAPSPPDPTLSDDRLNKAISTHMSRVRKTLAEQLTETITKSLSPIQEQLAGLSKRPGKGEDGEGEDEAKKQLQARIAELERKNQEAEQRAEQVRTQQRQSEERNALEASLRNAGIQPGLVRAAVSQLYTEDKRIGRDDDGQIVYKVKRAGYDEELSLDAGISEWLKDEGKSFLPPRGAAGSGATGSAAPRRKGGPMTKEERIAEARRTLRMQSGFKVPE